MQLTFGTQTGHCARIRRQHAFNLRARCGGGGTECAETGVFKRGGGVDC